MVHCIYVLANFRLAIRNLNQAMSMLLGWSAKSTPILGTQVCIGGGEKGGEREDT